MSTFVNAVINQEARTENGMKACQSDRYKQTWGFSLIEKLKTVKHCQIEELPQHVIFEDGEIFVDKRGAGGNRLLAFSRAKTGEKHYNSL